MDGAYDIKKSKIKGNFLSKGLKLELAACVEKKVMDL